MLLTKYCLGHRIKEECDGKLGGKRRHRWEDNVKIVLNERLWSVLLWFTVGFCEHSNEHFGAINCREFIDLLLNYWLFKKGCAAWSLFVCLLACLLVS